MEETFNYNCEKCNYSTNKSTNYSKHKKTKKHINNHIEELKEQVIENKKKKYQCDICNYYTNNPKGYSRHKFTEKHLKNLNILKEKYIKKEDFGLIYLIRLENNYYKVGMSKKCELDRLKNYNGIYKLKKELFLISVKNNKKMEDYLKEILVDYKYFEGITKEYFKWNYKNNYKENDKKILEVFEKEILYYYKIYDNI